jgi:hypothetical protein
MRSKVHARHEQDGVDEHEPVGLEHLAELAQELLVGVDLLAASRSRPELDLGPDEGSRLG